jgi:hypothetical protein
VRQIFAENGIDLDDAVNGVCLPDSENAPNTSAFRHKSNGGPLHDNNLAGRAIRNKLEEIVAMIPAGPARTAAIRQAMREFAKDATYGRHFWL